jgi:pimeloyl-ACP methyl ester carboxylesterase
MSTLRPGGRRPSRYEFSTATVTFGRDGDRREATLYRPDRPDEAPLIVLAGLLGGERTFGLPALAERLAERGLAAMPFDYRGLGGSEGEPRGLVSPPRMVADWTAALDAGRELDGVDARRVACWGVSLSGAAALRAAGEDRRVRAVVARAPVLDGRRVVRARPSGDVARLLAAGVRDRVGALLDRPYAIPVAAAPGGTGLLVGPGDREAYCSLVPRGSTWANETPARSALALARFSAAADAELVSAPTLFVAGADDALAPSAAANAAAGSMREATLVRLPEADHLDLVTGAAAERAFAHELAFLESELLEE